MARFRTLLLALLGAAVAALLGAGVGMLRGRLAPAPAARSAPRSGPAPATARASPAPLLAPPARAIEKSPPGAALEVLVTHAGAPRPGAEVRIYQRAGVEPRGGAPRWQRAGEATTGADGVASLPAQPGPCLVAARAPGLAPGHLLLSGPPPARARVALAAAAQVTGRVLARRGGKPVASAALLLLPADGEAAALPLPAEERPFATADAAGRFRLVAAPGSYLLQASAAGFSGARLRVAAPGPGAEILLAASGVIEGLVRGADGAPAAGAEVLISGGGDLTLGSAGSSGRFAVEVPPGSYAVAARTERSAGSWPVPVAVAAGGRAGGIAIRLGRPAALAGTVTGPGGAPVAGATISLAPSGGGELALARAGSDGRFALEPLAPGGYDLAVAAEGLGAWRRTGLTLLPGERAELPVALQAAGGVQGTVRDGAGRPVAGALVRAGRGSEEAPGARAEARTDEAGRYHLDGLDAGSVELTAARDGAAAGAAASVEVAPGGLVTTDLVLPEGGRLEGTVTRSDRGAAGRARVVLFPRGSHAPAASAAVDAGGSYALALAAGEYRALALPEGAAPAGAATGLPVRVAPGETARLDLVLRAPEGAATVVVREPDGTPSAGALVLATTPDDLRSAGSAVTDDDGQAHLLLAAAPAGLRVRAFRGGRFGGPVDLPAVGPSAVTLRAAARLRGRVRSPDGAAPAGFTLELAALGDEISTVSTVGGPAGLRGAQGVQAPRRLEFGGDRFEVADVPAGEVRVQVRTVSGRVASAEVTLAPGEVRELSLTLEPATIGSLDLGDVPPAGGPGR
ncbi:MAG: carboxypeptidase regulatory-like domain-containing protein [Deltaproteobacteria bacterium]|nr:carboxypeptidase regulatory-like domain-containing protein [Deltaproteobacteria bacterium]